MTDDGSHRIRERSANAARARIHARRFVPDLVQSV